ncbi:hypothetical protein E4U14_001965 [Claviceps sp. LM454 group G7]|nr:hypothetical protein E4U14_001965 [Claviceps sp. LM454 group G7]
MTSHSIDDDELHLMHPKIKTLEKYVSRSWFDSNGKGINLKTATQTDLNDQVIYRLDWFLKDEISGRKLHRIVCGGVHKEVVMIFRKVLSDNGVLVDENLIEGEDDTADPSEEDYAVNLPELPSVEPY